MKISQLTYIAVKDPQFHRLFLTMCPTYAFINRATGTFNKAMGLSKDYIAIISAMWFIDGSVTSYLDNLDEDKMQILKAIGIDISSSYDEQERRDEILRAIAALDKSHPMRKRYYGDGDVDELLINVH